MRIFSLLAFILFFASILDASYLREIRIVSVLNFEDAQKSLIELQKYTMKNENLRALQEEYKFEFKIIKKTKYHIIVAEPIRNRVVMQEVLDILRLKYTGAYPKKIIEKEIAVETNKKLDRLELEVKNAQTQERKKELVAKKEKPIQDQVSVEVQEVPIEKEKIIETNQLVNMTETQVPTEKITKDEKNISSSQVYSVKEYIWQIFFVLSFVVTLVFVRLWLRAKRKVETLTDKQMISEEKLVQIKDEIKNKDKLVSHVSHELRTPMTAIMGLSHLVLESDLSKLQKENIQRIEQSAQHLLNIINDILDVSKMQAGELKIEKSEFNINDIVDYVFNIISVQAKDNNIKLAIDIDHEVPSHVIGDSLRLGQILINILGNAVKFTKDGDIALSIQKLSSFSDSLVLEFSISDTGIGMTDEQVSQVFNSFSQAESSTSREFGGTGLGLSITKQLVEMMNGSIKVKSKKGLGSTFIFTIQFKLKDFQNKRQYRLPSTSFLNKRVLVVDSLNQNVIALEKSLGYFKYQIHTIPSFEEVVFDQKMQFDIIIVNENKLTDLALEKIKEIMHSNKAKLVVLNELYHSLNNNVPQDLNVDGYLKTPFTQQTMLNLIIELYVLKNSANSRKQNPKIKLEELAGKKILVAEDNEVNHKVISGLLSKSGIELTFVTDGQAAVDLIEKGIHFDMVLMDINMPIMDGYEATDEIRKHKKNDQLPIIALSADVMDEAIKKALNSGMQGHIAKPIIVDKFYKKLYDTLNTVDVKIENKDTLENTTKQNEEYEELSISTGLSRCNNDTEFYKSILKDFKIMYGDSVSTFENLCKVSHFSQARQMAMDIKDVTLNIGAYNLCENAATMEYEFEKGTRSNYKKLIKFYQIVLEKLFVDIDNYLQKD